MGAVNRKYLDELRALSPSNASSLVREIVDLFLKEADEKLSAFREALRTKNREDLVLLAHTLKGGSGNLGAEGLSALCHQLQGEGGEADWPELGQLVAKIEAEYVLVRATLKEETQR